MDLRPVTSDNDIAETAALAHEIWTEYWPQIIGTDQTRYMIEELQSPSAISKQIDDGYLYYLAGSDGVWQGYMGLVPEGERMMISKLYVKADTRGKGLGAFMINSIRSIAEELGCSVLWLVVNRENILAISVYEALGFTRTGTRVKDIGNGFVMDDYIYELPL